MFFFILVYFFAAVSPTQNFRLLIKITVFTTFFCLFVKIFKFPTLMPPKLGSFLDQLKLPKCFERLILMQCSLSFDYNWGKQNDRTACWHQLPPLNFREMSQLPTRLRGLVTELPKCVGRKGLHTIWITINEGQPENNQRF